MTEKENALLSLIHEVRSKGSSMSEAAALLPKASPRERQAMLRLMTQQARSLAEIVADFERKAAAEERNP